MQTAVEKLQNQSTFKLNETQRTKTIENMFEAKVSK